MSGAAVKLAHDGDQPQGGGGFHDSSKGPREFTSAESHAMRECYFHNLIIALMYQAEGVDLTAIEANRIASAGEEDIEEAIAIARELDLDLDVVLIKTAEARG